MDTVTEGIVKKRTLVTRERLIGVSVGLLVLCCAMFFGLRWIESAMTFHPIRIAQGETFTIPGGAEDVWFTTADSVRLHGWFFTSVVRETESPTIIYFHGNGGNISNVGWVGERFAQRGFNVLLFDYRGYGRSEGSCVGETELYSDGDAAVAFLINQKQIDSKTIVLYGQSLGTTVVTDLASRGEFGAVVLESGLSSASSLATTALPWLPRSLHFLGRNRFDSARKLTTVDAPVLVTHGDPDPVIPVDQGRLLFAAAKEPKQMIVVPGVGHNVFGSAGEQYQQQIEVFIREAVKRP
jgi:uncharacterized protein